MATKPKGLKVWVTFDGDYQVFLRQKDARSWVGYDCCPSLFESEICGNKGLKLFGKMKCGEIKRFILRAEDTTK